MTKTSFKLFLLSALLVITAPLTTLAQTNLSVNGGLTQDNQADTTVKLAAEQAITGNYYVMGNNISIDGNITGDLVCAANTVEVKGNIGGDVICAANTIIISGNVAGNVRSAASVINIDGSVAKNLTVATNNLVISAKGSIGSDAIFWAGQIMHEGSINGALRGMAYRAYLGGNVAQDVDISFEDGSNGFAVPLIISQQAKINGDLTYKSKYDASLANRDSVLGNVIKQQPTNNNMAMNMFANFWVWMVIFSVISAIIIGSIAIVLFRKQVTVLSDKMVHSAWPSILWGALLMFLVPIMVVLLSFTVVGIPVAIILGMIWLAMAMIAKPLAAIMIGYVVMGRYKNKVGAKKAKKQVETHPFWVMIIGVLVLYTLLNVPVVGMLISCLVSAWVVGALWMAVHDWSNKK